MDYKTIVRQRPEFKKAQVLLEDDLAFLVARMSMPTLRPWVKDIAAADTYSIDKGRFAFFTPNGKVYQCCMCMRCGNYDLQYSHTKYISIRALCWCQDGPKEDIHGNTMMELMMRVRQ